MFDGSEREVELNKLRELMMENWRDAHEFMLQVQAQKEVEDRMKLPDLDIDEVSLHSTTTPSVVMITCSFVLHEMRL